MNCLFLFFLLQLNRRNTFAWMGKLIALIERCKRPSLRARIFVHHTSMTKQAKHRNFNNNNKKEKFRYTFILSLEESFVCMCITAVTFISNLIFQKIEKKDSTGTRSGHLFCVFCFVFFSFFFFAFAFWFIVHFHIRKFRHKNWSNLATKSFI